MAKTPSKSEKKTSTPAPRQVHPMSEFRHEMDQLFDRFMGDFPRFPSLASWSDFDPFAGWPAAKSALSPSIDVSEGDKEYTITAELPGLDEKEIELSISDDLLTLKGEKKEEKDEKKKDFHVSERRYGTFQRSFRIPAGVKADDISADFKNGVLKVILPKSPEAKKSAKKVDIKKG